MQAGIERLQHLGEARQRMILVELEQRQDPALPRPDPVEAASPQPLPDPAGIDAEPARRLGHRQAGLHQRRLLDHGTGQRVVTSARLRVEAAVAQHLDLGRRQLVVGGAAQHGAALRHGFGQGGMQLRRRMLSRCNVKTLEC